MVVQGLPPGMQHRKETDVRAQIVRIVGHGQEGLSHGLKEEVVYLSRLGKVRLGMRRTLPARVAAGLAPTTTPLLASEHERSGSRLVAVAPWDGFRCDRHPGHAQASSIGSRRGGDGSASRTSGRPPGTAVGRGHPFDPPRPAGDGHLRQGRHHRKVVRGDEPARRGRRRLQEADRRGARPPLPLEGRARATGGRRIASSIARTTRTSWSSGSATSCPEADWRGRYDEIVAFEERVVDGATTIVKFMLHISYEEQRERLLARLDNPDKRWKFNEQDIEERTLGRVHGGLPGALDRDRERRPGTWSRRTGSGTGTGRSERSWRRPSADLDSRYPVPDLDVEGSERLQPRRVTAARSERSTQTPSRPGPAHQFVGRWGEAALEVAARHHRLPCGRRRPPSTRTAPAGSRRDVTLRWTDSHACQSSAFVTSQNSARVVRAETRALERLLREVPRALDPGRGPPRAARAGGS